MKNKKIERWVDYDFESSSTLTPEFASFSEEIKKELKRIMQGYKMINFSRGHFYFSTFFKKDEKYIYVSCSDVRGLSNSWYNNLLIRTAKNNRDYTGGSNNFCSLLELKEVADSILKNSN